MTNPIKGKVAFVVPSLARGGAERVMLDVATFFQENGCEVEIVLLCDASRDPEYETHSLNLVRLKCSRAAKSIFTLSRYLREHKPAIVIATLHYTNIVTTWAHKLARSRAKLYLREAITPSREGANNNDIKQRIIYRLMKPCYKAANGVIAVSTGVKRDLHEYLGLPVEKITVIQNPVNIARIETDTREVVDHTWYSTPEVPIVIAVGRLAKQKDYPTLLKAFDQAREHREMKLIILGEGECREDLEQIIRGMTYGDDVDMPGFTTNPFKYIGRSSLFVLSSLYEGMPNVLIQALACGCPVVSTDCESGPREILDNGRYGALVDVGDAHALARAIVESLKNPPPKECLIGRAQEYSLEVIGPQYAEALGLSCY